MEPRFEGTKSIFNEHRQREIATLKEQLQKVENKLANASDDHRELFEIEKKTLEEGIRNIAQLEETEVERLTGMEHPDQFN